MKTEQERRRELERMEEGDLIVLSDLAKGGGFPADFVSLPRTEAKKSWIDLIVAHEKSRGLIAD